MYAKIQSELFAQINRWRKEVNDEGVTDEFLNGGWSAKYPTKSLEEWQSVLKEWEQALMVEGKASRGPKRKKNER